MVAEETIIKNSGNKIMDWGKGIILAIIFGSALLCMIALGVYVILW
jgi:hypothetical protein